MKKLFILPLILLFSLQACNNAKVMKEKYPIQELVYNPANVEGTEAEGIADAKSDFAKGNYVKIYMGMMREPMINHQMNWARRILEKDYNITMLYGDDIMTRYKDGYIKTMDQLMKLKFNDNLYDEVMEKAKKELEKDFNKKFNEYNAAHPTEKVSKDDFVFIYQM